MFKSKTLWKLILYKSGKKGNLISFILEYITIIPWLSPSWIWSDKITTECVAWVGYNHFISNKGEWNNCFSKFSNRVLPRIFISTILQESGKSIQLPVTRAPTPAISWLLHNKKLRKRQYVVNLWRKPSSNYLTGQIQGKQTILEVFKCAELGALFSIWRKTPTIGSQSEFFSQSKS